MSASQTRNLFCVLVIAVAVGAKTTNAAAADKAPEKLSFAERESEIQRLNGEIRRLMKSPDAPASYRDAENIKSKFYQDRRDRYAEEQTLHLRLAALRDADEAVAWQRKIDALSDRLDEVESLHRTAVRGIGETLFRKRHASVAAAAAPATPNLKQLSFDALTFPRIDGSTSAQPLAVLIACRYFDAPYEWFGTSQWRQTPRKDPFDDASDDFLLAKFSGLPEPEADLLEFSLRAKADKPEQERLALIINRLLCTNASTHQAYSNLVSGRSDIGLLARRPSAAELKEAAMAGVEFDLAPCALDAFVFIVHFDREVTGLSSAQIRDIYSGKSRTWPAGGKITAYQRDEQSGSQQLMLELVMKNTPFDTHEGKWVPQLVGSIMSSHFLELTNDKTGIGYSLHYYEQFMSGSPKTKTIAVDGVAPSAVTIGNRTYPYVCEVFVVTRKNLPPEAPAAKLRAWLLSDEGQAVVRESGYVPLRAASAP